MVDSVNARRWLQVAPSVAAPPDGSDAGEVIRWYRKHRELTQQDAAVLLNTTQSRLSKIETGSLILGLDELRFIAGKLNIPPERLGILADPAAHAISQPDLASDSPGAPLASQQRWKAVRTELNANRAILGDLAAELYPQACHVPGSTALTRPDWMAPALVEIGDIDLYWLTEQPAKPTITGGIQQTESVRPLAADGIRYGRYSRALSDLARPKLLDNRVSYRLLDVEWTATGGRLGFGYTSYFETFDVCEAATHRMYLHQRDATAVAAGGSIVHVVPSGAFQPAGLAPAHQANDFSLWRNIQREYSEEFLGNPEHNGNCVDPIDYEHDEPFRSFAAARDAGDFRIFAAAVALFPLTLWAELLTIAVIKAPAFDRLFSDMVSVNEEGAAVSTEAGRPAVGIPFTSEPRERLRSEPLSPITQACIELAWQHRHTWLAG